VHPFQFWFRYPRKWLSKASNFRFCRQNRT
jgi:hypothetical protein